ncbi:MAG: hypothetical protein NW220_06905 [Leptolyngbyaceae cyanobacterium bins.349]|nr:hypothetical protein [Leptolyngbyaceae cyanobacterium bins.349]
MVGTRTKSLIQKSVVDEVIQVLAMLPDRAQGEAIDTNDSGSYAPVLKSSGRSQR